eukprot:jgi/Mesen1/8812/ME000053S08221
MANTGVRSTTPPVQTASMPSHSGSNGQAPGHSTPPPLSDANSQTESQEETSVADRVPQQHQSSPISHQVMPHQNGSFVGSAVRPGTEYIGLKYGPQTILLVDPSSSNANSAVSFVQHYQGGGSENGLQVIGRFQLQDLAGGHYGDGGNSMSVTRVLDRHSHVSNMLRQNGEEGSEGGEEGEGGAQVSGDSMRELEDLLTKLNPLAKEFVPPGSQSEAGTDSPPAQGKSGQRKKKGGSGSAKKKSAARSNRALREDSVRRTVYVSDIDQQVTEEQLAALFLTCGQVVDCRVCGDPNSVLRFAFVEFTNEEGAQAALSLAGTVLGFYPVRVLPSKTAIVPVNPTFLPRSEDEREMCGRTIYCTNIDKKVTQADVKLFFESLCGEVARLRLLGDYHHSTRIAFVEFIMSEPLEDTCQAPLPEASHQHDALAHAGQVRAVRPRESDKKPGGAGLGSIANRKGRGGGDSGVFAHSAALFRGKSSSTCEVGAYREFYQVCAARRACCGEGLCHLSRATRERRRLWWRWRCGMSRGCS